MTEITEPMIPGLESLGTDPVQIVTAATREELLLSAVIRISQHMKCLTTGEVSRLPNGLGLKFDRRARAAHFSVLARTKARGEETRRDLLNQQVLDLFVTNDQVSVKLELEKLAAAVLDWLVDLELREG